VLCTNGALCFYVFKKSKIGDENLHCYTNVKREGNSTELERAGIGLGGRNE
jgi:hypothetical protein